MSDRDVGTRFYSFYNVAARVKIPTGSNLKSGWVCNGLLFVIDLCLFVLIILFCFLVSITAAKEPECMCNSKVGK